MNEALDRDAADQPAVRINGRSAGPRLAAVDADNYRHHVTFLLSLAQAVRSGIAR
jgi:hypothetical protein